MRKTGLSLVLFGLLAVVSLPTTSAHAQATRTWVSGVGDDVNPCSRTAPCKTFAGAISKTAAGGEIDCLDPGGFGAVTVTKSMTIDCTGVSGGILAASSNGVIVNAGVNDKVVLRNLVIQGTISVNTGVNGIRWLAGKELQLDRVVVQGFTTQCVDVNKTAAGTLYVVNSYFTECPNGINMTSTAPFVIASVDSSNFNGVSANGVAVGANSIANISNSTFSSSGVSGASVSASGAFLNLNKNVFRNNTTAISAVSGANLRTVDNDLFDNTTGINATGASWVSAGNNRVVGGTTISNGTSTIMQVR
ncbi:MAG: hypothetical protein JWR80_5812 [Bradyrhizobium sp.]|nr:hypothetical protein [Bradyrhizobium sp.]